LNLFQLDEMLRVVIFDFDGVLIETADIKTRAFKSLFSDFPSDIVAKILDYHISNGGISRHIKFQHIYREILKLKLSAETMDRLSEQFSKITLENVIRAPFVPGAMDFIKRYSSKYNFFIVSGTPNSELQYIVDKRNIGQYFTQVSGSPKTKINIIDGILKRYSFKPSEAVFVGDSLSDMEAANKCGIDFIARINLDNSYTFESCEYNINDLTELEDLLDAHFIID